MQDNDSVGDYLTMAAGAVIAVLGLIGIFLWLAYKLLGLLVRLVLWLVGIRWAIRAAKRQFQEYWVWRNSAAWKLRRYERQVAREWEYIRRDVPWDQLRPGFRSLGARLVEWFQDRSFPAWIHFRLTAKPAKTRGKQEAL